MIVENLKIVVGSGWQKDRLLGRRLRLRIRSRHDIYQHGIRFLSYNRPRNLGGVIVQLNNDSDRYRVVLGRKSDHIGAIIIGWRVAGNIANGRFDPIRKGGNSGKDSRVVRVGTTKAPAVKQGRAMSASSSIYASRVIHLVPSIRTMTLCQPKHRPTGILVG